MNKTILTLTIMLVLLGMTSIAEDLPLILIEEPNNFMQTTIGGSYVQSSTLDRGAMQQFKPSVKFLHDSEKTKFQLKMLKGSLTTSTSTDYGYSTIITSPHKTGDLVSYTLANADTSKLPESWCNSWIYGDVQHYSYYDGAWHNEGEQWGGFTDNYFLACPSIIQSCDYKPTGSKYCQASLIMQDYQQRDCTTKSEITFNCGSRGCENGACKVECGEIPSTIFCQNNNVYRKVLATSGSECYADQLVMTCNEGCDAGTCTTTPTPTPTFECGDAQCSTAYGETDTNCPEDCQKTPCNPDDELTKTCADSTIITTHECNNGVLIATSNKCEGEKSTNYTTFIILGGLAIVAAGIIFKAKKKGGKKR